VFLTNKRPLETPVKEKAAFSEQLINKYENEKGNKKVENCLKMKIMTSGQKRYKLLNINYISLYILSKESILFLDFARLNNF